jgi:hypothetical protein
MSPLAVSMNFRTTATESWSVKCNFLMPTEVEQLSTHCSKLDSLTCYGHLLNNLQQFPDLSANSPTCSSVSRVVGPWATGPDLRPSSSHSRPSRSTSATKCSATTSSGAGGRVCPSLAAACMHFTVSACFLMRNEQLCVRLVRHEKPTLVRRQVCPS